MTGSSYRYCPQCGAEHRAGFVRCFDCQVPLVDTPPSQAAKSGVARDLVEVYRASRVDAQLVSSALEGNGIGTVTDDAGSGMYPVRVGDLGAAGVFVQSADVADALDVISTYEAALAGELHDDEPDEEVVDRPLLWERPFIRIVALLIAVCMVAVYGLDRLT